MDKVADLGDLAFLVEALTKTSRCSEALDTLEAFVQKKESLDQSERQLFERAFKTAIDPVRDTLRSLVVFYDNESDPGKAELIKKYQESSHNELTGLCTRAIALIKTKLLPGATDSSAKVFYLKALGDYHRYMAEFESEEGPRNEAAEFYRDAVQISDSDLLKSDPLRLGLILNYAIFLFDHMRRDDEPVEMLQRARKDAEIDLAQLDAQQKSQSLDVLRAMRANLAVWCDETAK